jgi:signal transduction histidine kinase
LDGAAILTEALRGALNLLGLEGGAVYRLDAAAQQLVLAGTHQLAPEPEAFLQANPLPLDERICRQLALSNKPLILDEKALAAMPQLLPGENFRCQMLFPLLVKGQLTGLFYLLTSSPHEAAHHSSIELTQQLCSAVALALENARLYETVQRYAEELEERVTERTTQLAAINQELEAFNYSIAHDLRAPLRAIDGFSRILLQDYAGQFSAESKSYLDRMIRVSQNMHQLIDGLLALSHLTQRDMQRQPVNLSNLARIIAADLSQHEPDRHVTWSIADNLQVQGDPHLLRTVLENLIGNAWKFSAHQPQAQIEFGQQNSSAETIFFVRDNGVGFNPDYTRRLFGVFQRLHTQSEFPGTGIGLASVRRIVQRHGGRVWTEGQVNQGATFYFTLK